MSSGSIWSVLGISKTTDAVEIRRAYACRLKLTNPEDDPAGFQALRQAYEAALRQARSGGPAIKPPPRAAEVKIETPLASIDHPDETELEPDLPAPARPEDRPVDQAILLHRSDHAAYEASFRRLTKLVASGDASAADLQAALDELLASPALDAVSTQEEAESRMANLILGQAPKADALIARVVGHFGWELHTIGRRDKRRDAVVVRQRDLAVITDLQRPSSPDRVAFLALRRAPRRWRVLAHMTTVGLRGKVKVVLTKLQTAHPGGLSALNPDAVAWWQTYLARSQIPAWILWAGVFLALAAAICAPAFDPGATPAGRMAAFAVTLAAVVGPVAVWVYGVARPRAAWRSQWRWRAPPWLRLGWAPAALCLPIAAAAAPGSLTLAYVLAVVAAGVLIWAVITGEADERPGRYGGGLGGMPAIIAVIVASVRIVFGQDTWAPWPLRAVLSWSYLAVFWLVIEHDVGENAWRHMTLPLLGAALAFSFGGQTLAGLWRGDIKPKAQQRFLIGLAVCAAVIPMLLWFIAPGRALAPVAAAWTAAVYLAHRPVTSRLNLNAARILNLVRGIGGPVCLAGAGFAADTYRQGEALLLFAGIWLLGGAAFSLLATLHEMRAARPA